MHGRTVWSTHAAVCVVGRSGGSSSAKWNCANLPCSESEKARAKDSCWLFVAAYRMSYVCTRPLGAWYKTNKLACS